MSFYGSMKVNFIKASTEEKLAKQLHEVELLHKGMIKVINIYRGGTGVVAWYYHDVMKAGAPIRPKKAKKKVSKKAAK